MKTSTTRLCLAVALLPIAAVAKAQSINLASYSLVGTYSLPIQAPGLAIQYEASAVTWNRGTNSLFIVGDGGRYIQQTSLTGAVIDSMALPTTTAPSRAGVEFDDPEGLTWIGGNTFVMTEERKRNVVRFDYALSNVGAFAGSASNNLLVLTNAGGIKEVTRAGVVVSQRTIPSGTSQIEGITMDDRGYIYVVSDNGDFGNSQVASSLFVYAPIPEPQTYAMLVAGLGLIGAFVRRRRA